MSSKIENLSIVIPILRESKNIKKLTEDIIKNINGQSIENFMQNKKDVQDVFMTDNLIVELER